MMRFAMAMRSSYKCDANGLRVMERWMGPMNRFQLSLTLHFARSHRKTPAKERKNRFGRNQPFLARDFQVASDFDTF